MAKVKPTTIEKLKSGTEITLYSHYTGCWCDTDSTFRVFYTSPNYQTSAKKLVGIIKVDLDDDGIPVLDFTRLDASGKELKPLITKYVFALFGVKIPESDGDDIKIDGLVVIPKNKLRDLIGFTIYGQKIIGLLTEDTADGSHYLFRTQDGIKSIKDVFKTTKLIIKED
jgi:hypothetical protein